MSMLPACSLLRDESSGSFADRLHSAVFSLRPTICPHCPPDGPCWACDESGWLFGDSPTDAELAAHAACNLSDPDEAACGRRFYETTVSAFSHHADRINAACDLIEAETGEPFAWEGR